MASRNLYILRIKLSWAKGIWREIAICGDQTLADLHKAILDAFEWVQDDSYRFYVSDDLDDLGAGYDMKISAQAYLDEFDLDEDQEFLYFFSDGERNQFRIRVMSIDEPEIGMIYPDVVDESGESPEQELAYEDD